MKKNSELEVFNSAMDMILKADPAKVKAEMQAEIEVNKRERKARGEQKRGRKAKKQPSAKFKEKP